jgi:hypothetical protein
MLLPPLASHANQTLAQFVRLAALYPDRKLYALTDIELLWKTHLIRPAHYRKVASPTQVSFPFLLPVSVQEMEDLFGCNLHHAERAYSASYDADSLADTEQLWVLHYDEPYNSLQGQPQSLPTDCRKPRTALPSGGVVPSWEEVEAKISLKPRDVEKDARWLPHLLAFAKKQVSERALNAFGPIPSDPLSGFQNVEELCKDEDVLRRCVEGYAKFLTECKHQTGTDRDGPTYDVDLMWYVNQMMLASTKGR